MDTNILTPSEYKLLKNDRQAQLASILPKIDYPDGIGPFLGAMGQSKKPTFSKKLSTLNDHLAKEQMTVQLKLMCMRTFTN